MATHKFEDMDRVLRQQATKVIVGTERAVAVAVSEGHRSVVDNTPVDRGTARSNWLVSKDAPVEFSILPYAPGRKLGRSERANYIAAIAQGKQVTAAFKIVKDVESVFITNNVDYIQDLNDGSSKQNTRPINFLERARTAMKAALRGVRILR